MKTAAIICEYNPFHNGHLYQIEEIKRQLKPDHIIAVMSGDFVQRGTPAFCDKYDRSRFALTHGVDLVLELPVCYSSASAEYFAHGSISLLNSLNCVDHLVFGIEDGSLEALQVCADLLAKEPEAYTTLLQEQLRKGMTFPAARACAASRLLGEETASLLNTPNNILAVEYLKALSSCNSSIRPYPIRRIGSDYHETTIAPVSSASGIREEILHHGISSRLAHAIPDDVFQFFKSDYQVSFPIELQDFSDMIQYQFLMDPHPESYLDYHPELMDRIRKMNPYAVDINAWIAHTKSKNFTYTRISRYFSHLLLQITETQASSPCPYAKILGIRKDHSKLVKHLNEKASVPVIQKISQYQSYLEPEGIACFEQTLRASRLYRYAVHKKYHTEQISELSQPLLIV